jgi:putative acyl-CoA dehydrogenase
MTAVAVEAMECLGGNGYVEEGPMARLYREAPLNGIWEGSANVICLDVLRALGRLPAALDLLAGEVALARDPRLDRVVEDARRALREPATAEGSARSVLESLALAVQGSLMKRLSDPAAAEAFVASRMEGTSGARAFGTLALGIDALEALVQRARLED